MGEFFKIVMSVGVRGSRATHAQNLAQWILGQELQYREIASPVNPLRRREQIPIREKKSIHESVPKMGGVEGVSDGVGCFRGLRVPGSGVSKIGNGEVRV